MPEEPANDVLRRYLHANNLTIVGDGNTWKIEPASDETFCITNILSQRCNDLEKIVIGEVRVGDRHKPRPNGNA